MIKYIRLSRALLEVPDELSLCLEITNCPHKCPYCHSPELRDDIGLIVTPEEIDRLLEEHKYTTCICFMGGPR